MRWVAEAQVTTRSGVQASLVGLWCATSMHVGTGLHWHWTSLAVAAAVVMGCSEGSVCEHHPAERATLKRILLQSLCRCSAQHGHS